MFQKLPLEGPLLMPPPDLGLDVSRLLVAHRGYLDCGSLITEFKDSRKIAELFTFNLLMSR